MTEHAHIIIHQLYFITYFETKNQPFFLSFLKVTYVTHVNRQYISMNLPLLIAFTYSRDIYY